VQHLAEFAGADQITDVRDSRRTAVGESDPGDARCGVRGIRHPSRVVQGVAERLLAQHVLAGREQTLHHLTV